jgi:hypothetical protein
MAAVFCVNVCLGDCVPFLARALEALFHGPAFMQKFITRQEIPKKLADAKRTAVKRLLAGKAARPHVWAVRAHPTHNLVGVGIGRKIKGGRPTRASCVRFYVEHKIARNALPDELLLPKSIGGAITDVIESGRFRAFAPIVPPGQNRLRPAVPGCSIGFQFADALGSLIMVGTLGAVVEADGVQYILSNNHVLANENHLPLGSPIYQPSLLDGGNAATDRIGTLTRFVPLSTADHNLVDCAIARIEDGAVTSVSPPNIGRLTSPQPIDAVEGMRVEKTGRSTGHTIGTVTEVSISTVVEYETGLYWFDDQILIQGDAGNFSDAGDSGSLVIDVATGRATGMLMGGGVSQRFAIANHIGDSDLRKFSIANHIGDVLGNLNVTLVT